MDLVFNKSYCTKMTNKGFMEYKDGKYYLDGLEVKIIDDLLNYNNMFSSITKNYIKIIVFLKLPLDK